MNSVFYELRNGTNDHQLSLGFLASIAAFCEEAPSGQDVASN